MPTVEEKSQEKREIYLTNGIGEDTGHFGYEEFADLGLGHGEAYGSFYPLTNEEQLVASELMTIEDYPNWLGLYTTLLDGNKYHTPTLELPFKDKYWGDDADRFAFEADTRIMASRIKAKVQNWAKMRGGEVLIEEDMPARIVVRIRYPIANAI